MTARRDWRVVAGRCHLREDPLARTGIGQPRLPLAPASPARALSALGGFVGHPFVEPVRPGRARRAGGGVAAGMSGGGDTDASATGCSMSAASLMGPPEGGFCQRQGTTRVASHGTTHSALAVGTPVVTSTGSEFGKVHHVLQVPELDLLDGISVTTRHGLRVLWRDQIVEITTTLVRCALTEEQAASLPAPSGPPVLDLAHDEGSSRIARLGRLLGRPHWRDIGEQRRRPPACARVVSR